jgi:probable HAF family extracellular repeat protein
MNTTNDRKYLKVGAANRPVAKKYSITNIRPTGKSGFSTASAINDVGQVVGHGAEDGKSETLAFAWSNEFGLVPDLGSVYGRSCFATNINGKGVIVGYVSTDNNSLRAFLLGQGQMFDLGMLASTEYDESFSVATDINEEGHIVGYSHNNDNNLHAYLWTHETGMIDLGGLGSGRSYAYAINDAGTIVGWSQVDDSRGYRAFTWRQETGMIEMPGKAILPTVAYGLNEQGIICGAAATNEFANVLQAVVWTATGLVELGTLRGFAFSSGYAISDAGQVVGWCYPTAHCELKHGRAIIWDRTNGLQDLNDLIDHATGWILNKATGINNDGEIVGCGIYEGKQQSFLLTPEDYARLVTNYLTIQELNLITNQRTGVVYRTIVIKNSSHKMIKGPLQLIFHGLAAGIVLAGSAGEFDGCPIWIVRMTELHPKSQISTTIQFSNPDGCIIDYELECYAGYF